MVIILYGSFFQGARISNKWHKIELEASPVVGTPLYLPGENSPDALAISSQCDASSDSTVAADGALVNENELRRQRALGEDALDAGQRKYMRMPDDRFIRSIEKDIFLPEYIVKAKLGSENNDVVSIAKRELDDRDKFSILYPAEQKTLYGTDSADEYMEAMKTQGSLSLADAEQPGKGGSWQSVSGRVSALCLQCLSDHRRGLLS